MNEIIIGLITSAIAVVLVIIYFAKIGDANTPTRITTETVYYSPFEIRKTKRCDACGTLISEEEYVLQDGLCEDCFLGQEEDDEDSDLIFGGA